MATQAVMLTNIMGPNDVCYFFRKEHPPKKKSVLCSFISPVLRSQKEWIALHFVLLVTKTSTTADQKDS